MNFPKREDYKEQYNYFDALDKWRQEHPEWNGSVDLAEFILEQPITGFQKLTIGRTDVFRLRFDNGTNLRIHGFKDLKDPDIIKLFVEKY